MTPVRALCTLAAAAAVAFATPTHAQYDGRIARPIQPGQTLAGRLTESDPRADDRGAFQAFTFETEPGAGYTIDLHSDEFDAYLQVFDASLAIAILVAEDDDGGQGTDAHVRIRTRERTRLLVVVQSLEVEELGEFVLRVEDDSAESRPASRPIQLGDSVSEMITLRNPIEDGRRYDLWSFSTDRPQRVRVHMTSPDFAAFVSVLRVEGDEWNEVAMSGGDGTDAVVTLTADGRYVIAAAPLHDGELGRYTLRLEALPQPAPASPRPVRVNGTASGQLGDDSPGFAEGMPFGDWQFQARRGERYRVSVASREFSPMLMVGRSVGGRLEELRWDDDGDCLDGRVFVEFEAPETAGYVIRATTRYPWQAGAYSVEVEQLR